MPTPLNKRLFTLLRAVTLFAVLLATVTANAQIAPQKPFLHPLFSENMVLQRGVPVPVWGWTTPGSRVTVAIAGKTAAATADPQGKWMAKLPSLPVGGPYTLAISGPENVTRKNVLVGDVWICSGQSNMQMGVGVSKDAAQEIAAANYPQIRLFTVPNIPANAPKETINGTWSVCSPTTIGEGGWGGFSAVAYYFGRTLNQELKIPIGLIHTSWGGTIAEAWVSGDALKKNVPEFTGQVAMVEAAARERNTAALEQRIADWFLKNDAGSAPNAHWQSTDIDAAAWKTMTLPSSWEKAGMPGFDGVVWFRKEITLSDADAARKDAVLNLGPIDDNDTAWINGVNIGMTENYQTDRQYKIPANVLKSGKNVIVVRVLDTGGEGGMYGTPSQLSLSLGGIAPLSLAGAWQYNIGADLKKTTPYPMALDNNPNVTTVLYNGMIAPLVPFGVKGAIWYQGESNAGRDEQYRRLLPALINDWRGHFGVGPFPFYIVQLASFLEQDTEPRDDDWPRLREAQYLTTKTVPNAGIATAIDIGEANDIHPKNKQEVGRRLALNALALTYGKKIEYSGPVYKSHKSEGDAIRLTFDHRGGGLVAQGGIPLKGFAIAGADNKFVWADARIDGDTVIVSSASVTSPVAVHYAWSNNPVCNLYNKAGLPALPFRTDGPAAPK